jgi:aspartate aminotransferase
MNLSARAKSLKPSPTLSLASKAKELKAQGHSVISLSVGEPDWDSVKVAKEAGIKAIQDGFTKYTPASGTPELRQAIAEQTSKDLGVDYSTTEVTVSSGGKFVIFSALQTLLDPGDEVIIPAPYWVSYPEQVSLTGATPKIVVCGKETNFKMSAEKLESSITPKTKLIIFNSPSNPTGVMYSDSELKDIAAVLKKHTHVYFLSDDIYNRLIFEGEVAPHILHHAPELKDRVLVINGASKTYSMTGWRCGWALGNQQWIKAMTDYQSQSTSGACSITDKATYAAVTQGGPELKEILKELKRRRDFVVKSFNDIPGFDVREPDGAFYIWPNIEAHFGKSFNGAKIQTSSDFSKALLDSQKVVAVPGEAFGLDGYLRISYALKDSSMQEAADRIRTFVGQLT